MLMGRAGLAVFWVVTALVTAKGQSAEITLKNCGIATVGYGKGDRIVGGRDALDGEYPWQVSLRYKSLFIKPTHLCGASILNNDWIITAAHCVYQRAVRHFEIGVGIYKQGEKGPYTATYQIDKIIPHENFNSDTFENDIALIKLKKSIVMTKSKGFINGICLPDSRYNASGFSVATGWGSTEEDGDMSPILQTVELPIVPHIICEILYDDLITKGMLCAGEPTGGVDTCQGDSGGPLIQTNPDGQSMLIGIVSWGIGCARPGLPGIYTSVTDYLDWITNKVQ